MKPAPPQVSPTSLAAAPSPDARIRELEERLRSLASVRAENEKLKAEIRLLRVPPREGAKCPTCGMVRAASPGRSPRSPVAPPRGRTESVADGSPRKKALPVAPPSDDEEEEPLPPLPEKPASGARPGSPRRGSLLQKLDAGQIRRDMQDKYGSGVDYQGSTALPPPPEDDEGEDDSDSDAPLPPPKPVAMMRASSQQKLEGGNANVPSLPLQGTGSVRVKSPRYASDPMKASIPEFRQSRSSVSSDASKRRISNVDYSDRESGTSTSSTSSPSVSTSSKRLVGSLSKGTSQFISGMFRRGNTASVNMDDQEDSEATASTPPDSFGTLGRSHSLMDPAESLRWRRQAIGEGGQAAVTLTPINVTTINKTIYYMVRAESPDTSWVVPRTYEQFRDFRQNLLFEFPTASVPSPPSKLFKGNVKEKSVGDRLTWLQSFLDALLADPQLAGSVLLLKFLDPFYRPSPLALRAIVPLKEGMLQYRSEKTSGKGMKNMLCLLKHDLYVFRSVEDSAPFEVVALDYCTIDLVPDSADVPRFAFQVVSLKEGETFLFAAASSKELADWILNIRDEKTKRVSFCVGEEPVEYANVRESNESRSVAAQLLADYAAMSPADQPALLKRCELPSDFVPPKIRPEPEAGLSVDVKGGIIAATEQKLLHVAFKPERSSFTSQFLIAFRYFSTPLEVLTYLKESYLLGSPPVKAHCVSVLETWLTEHVSDFIDSLLLTQFMMEFVLVRMARNDEKRVRQVLKMRLDRNATALSQAIPTNSPQSIMPQIFRGSGFDLLDLAPLELARQITLHQHRFFATIDLRELLQEAWAGPEGPKKAPRVNAFISDFNHLLGFASSTIVTTRPPIPRIALLHRWIDTAKCCLELSNFNATMALVGALLSNPVHRLKDDWEALPKDSQETFAELKNLFSTSGNWKNYRAALSVTKPPAVPYLGLALQDLTFLETNKNTKVVATMTMVNLEKSEKIRNVLDEVHKFQVEPFCLKPVPAIQSYLARAEVLSSDEQDAHSYQIRPKGRGGGDASPRKFHWKKEFGSPRRAVSSEVRE